MSSVKVQDDEEGQQTGRPEPITKREIADSTINLQKQTAVFHWDDVCYDITIKKEPRRLLNEVDGWVKPGTLTALMVLPKFKSTDSPLMYSGCLWRWKNYTFRCSG